MVLPILYHFAYSTCSQKVRMALAEKGQQFESREINLLAGEQHNPDYVRLNPDHVVPTMVRGDEVMTESSLINDYIDDAFDGAALRSVDPIARYRAASIIHHVDNKLHGKVTGVFAHGVVTRAIVGARPPEAVEAYLNAIPDPAERKLRTSLIKHGTDAPEMPPAVDTMVAFFARMEALLEKQAWLSGDSFGLADICVAPYAVRFDEMGFVAFWNQGFAPRVERWIARMRARPSFDVAFTRWMPEATAATFKTLGEAVCPRIEPLIRRAQGR